MPRIVIKEVKKKGENERKWRMKRGEKRSERSCIALSIDDPLIHSMRNPVF